MNTTNQFYVCSLNGEQFNTDFYLENTVDTFKTKIQTKESTSEWINIYSHTLASVVLQKDQFLLFFIFIICCIYQFAKASMPVPDNIRKSTYLYVRHGLSESNEQYKLVGKQAFLDVSLQDARLSTGGTL